MTQKIEARSRSDLKVVKMGKLTMYVNNDIHLVTKSKVDAPKKATRVRNRLLKPHYLPVDSTTTDNLNFIIFRLLSSPSPST